MEKFNYDINDVMLYFCEISKIPRMSGKEEKIANYIENFAKGNKLQYFRDVYNNVVVIKEANKSSSQESIILQCHLDMVCEKDENSNHNFETDSLDLYIDDDYIRARGTSLGADNGIGIAIILSILSSKEICHPRIEAIFTVQEETTMMGAKQIDLNVLKGNKMICLDNMSEDELLVGCAGAKIFDFEIDGEIVEKNVTEYKLIKIVMNGFRGGHSGKDIAKGRGNPIKEMIHFLKDIFSKYDITLKNIYGGKEVNVIPRECSCEIYINNKDFNKIKQEVLNYNKKIRENIKDNENIIVCLEDVSDVDYRSFNKNTTKKVIDIINNIPSGVYYKDKYDNPIVSLNIGKIDNDIKKINLYFSIRYNKKVIEEQLEVELNRIINKYKIEYTENELAGYEHIGESPFIKKCTNIYNYYFEKKPKIINMHICLEAGFFGTKIPNLDFIAIAPNIYDAHSPKERCSISSLKKIYNYILLILKEL